MVEKILKAPVSLHKLGSAEINPMSASTQSAARWRSKLIKMALCGTMLPICGGCHKVILSPLSVGLQAPPEGTPATAIWPQVQTYNRSVLLSIFVKAFLQFVSEPNLLSALLCGHSKKTGRLFSTGWILVLKENKRRRIQSQTVNTGREKRRKDMGRGALDDCDYFGWGLAHCLQNISNHAVSSGPRGTATPERESKHPATGQPAACSVIDWLQPFWPLHTWWLVSLSMRQASRAVWTLPRSVCEV